MPKPYAEMDGVWQRLLRFFSLRDPIGQIPTVPSVVFSLLVLLLFTAPYLGYLAFAFNGEGIATRESPLNLEFFLITILLAIYLAILFGFHPRFHKHPCIDSERNTLSLLAPTLFALLLLFPIKTLILFGYESGRSLSFELKFGSAAATRDAIPLLGLMPWDVIEGSRLYIAKLYTMLLHPNVEVRIHYLQNIVGLFIMEAVIFTFCVLLLTRLYTKNTHWFVSLMILASEAIVFVLLLTGIVALFDKLTERYSSLRDGSALTLVFAVVTISAAVLSYWRLHRRVAPSAAGPAV